MLQFGVQSVHLLLASHAEMGITICQQVVPTGCHPAQQPRDIPQNLIESDRLNADLPLPGLLMCSPVLDLGRQNSSALDQRLRGPRHLSPAGMKSRTHHLDWPLFWILEVILISVPTLITVIAGNGAQFLFAEPRSS